MKRKYLVFVCFGGWIFSSEKTNQKKKKKTVKEIKSYIDYSQKKGLCGTENSITRNEGKGATDMNYMEAK